ncbi:YheT family hydrolase [Crocosphaera chwakensis]|uniref:Alpha/beta hydrolase fold protein n=1 Tax=Crocosphaera chwakensis CCY0110 TaxID=391612 RepID=A3IS94_9CHRO|nr:alpha/beta fold hydrolase [Crocosphaera chwakensis]EAZ90610.1 Alpha/beta hydrolase fold protein [Crocosphaera chwakensis CCY0110]
MNSTSYTPPWGLKNGLSMSVYSGIFAGKNWEKNIQFSEPTYEEKIFTGAQETPIFGLVAIPKNPRGTIVGTYGIVGDLDNQWYLRVLARKAYAAGYAVVIFDWRAHGKTAELSPTLTSDGIYEGEDYVRIAAEAKTMGCPAPFWLTGFSLGGQLALWGIKSAQTLASWGQNLPIEASDIAGGAVICPNLDSNRSLSSLVSSPWGQYIEKRIAKQLKKLAWKIYKAHPENLDPEAIRRANSIWGFDDELVIKRLGFSSVEEYYQASSPLPLLPNLSKPTLIFYAADDPLFDPSIIPDLKAACKDNSYIDLRVTQYGGHVGYISNKNCQREYGDSDRWWAWNRILDWFESK